MQVIKEIIENKEKKTIKQVEIYFNHKKANEIMKEGQEKYKRIISSKQINPVVMSKILELFSNNISISKISKLIGFSRKTIKNNLNKCKTIENKFEQQGKIYNKKIYFYKILIRYSIDVWSKNWLLNSASKSNVWTQNSEIKYQKFLDWFFSFVKTYVNLKISVNVLLYHWDKYLKENNLKNEKTLVKSTIYYWIRANKYKFSKQKFIKLSQGLYFKKKKKTVTKIYNDNSKSILEFREDTKNNNLSKAYEIDLVKGKLSDKYSILTCLNKKTRMLYAKITKPNALDVKNNLIKIINENNLQIDQLIIDNGSENVLLNKISSIKQIYRCRPYCSSDKGQIENIHRLLRYWIKKGVSIDKISQIYLNQVVNIINDYPREIYQSGKLMSAIEFSKMI